MTIDECLAALDTVSLGRVGYVAEQRPHIVPVNYLLHTGMILFRTTYGHTLDSIGGGAEVVFEVDHYQQDTGSGWSVLIHGRAEEIWLPDELSEAQHLPLQPWAPGERAHYVRIAPSSMTGRRIN